MVNLQGLLISLLYYSDPAMTSTIGQLFRYLRKVYVNDYGSHQWVKTGTLENSSSSVLNVRLGGTDHDLIAQDTSSNLRSTKNNHQQVWDPYHYRWLAVFMHWLLTKVCWLTPALLTASSSSSTLSYHTAAKSQSSSAPNSATVDIHSTDNNNDDMVAQNEATSSPLRSSIQLDQSGIYRLSGSIDSPSTRQTITNNIGYAPLNAPPASHVTITLSPEHGTVSPHGVVLDPTLLDWGTFFYGGDPPLLMDSDGLGHGWTSLIHITSRALDTNRRIVMSVEHWVNGYLGSRWFVAE
ncbi:hypothetical protein BC941DRAFT_422012 [Chlamydoabsidia padenii]|nr:hypothetical protein BC941DRAFT_422012 [Chlamydoabsidia padenii]